MVSGISVAENLLCDPGFERSTPVGTFPDSGCWGSSTSNKAGGAGAACTTTSARTGNNGLWIYTGSEGSSYWFRTYQEASASQGQTYRGSAWIRTPSATIGGEWVSGSKACVRVEFMDKGKNTLSYFQSACVEASERDWQEYSVTTGQAPSGTSFVRFICNIEKPSGSGGISVANFDDCSLELISNPTPVVTPTNTPSETPTPTPKVTLTPIPTSTPLPTSSPISTVTPCTLFDSHIIGVDYGPYRDGQNPDKGIYPTSAQMQEDMTALKDFTDVIRTYSVTNGLEDIVGFAYKQGLKVAPGAWLSDNEYNNDKECNNLIELTGKHDNIPFVVVGSEAIYRYENDIAQGLSKDKVIEQINRVKKNVSVPVTTAEPFHIWLNNSDLADAVDLLFINIHPYWEGIHVDEAVDHVLQKYREVKDAYPDKCVVISETGWPSDGNSKGQAQPGINNLKTFAKNLIDSARKELMDVFYFEAFDEKWKEESNDVGPHWGLYYSDRTQKFPIDLRPTPSPTPTSTPSCSNDGDVNEDGKLTAKDALLAFEYVLGKITLTSCQQSHADANGNGKVTAADALCIFKAVLNGSSPSETLSCE
jgi:exo-beta-1,3-glucanase (GH17 family)